MKILLFLLALLATAPASLLAQEDLQLRPDNYKLSKAAKKQLKQLTGTWDMLTIEVQGRTINYKEYDEMQIIFYDRTKKNDKTKKSETNYYYKANWPARGVDRIFEYFFNEGADSIKFVGVKGYNDVKIVSVDDKNLVLDQISDGSVQRWTLERLKIAAQDDKGKKKKKEKKK
jgi:hypothetical protein